MRLVGWGVLGSGERRLREGKSVVKGIVETEDLGVR